MVELDDGNENATELEELEKRRAHKKQKLAEEAAKVGQGLPPGLVLSPIILANNVSGVRRPC